MKYAAKPRCTAQGPWKQQCELLEGHEARSEMPHMDREGRRWSSHPERTTEDQTTLRGARKAGKAGR